MEGGGCHTFGPPTVTLFERRGHFKKEMDEANVKYHFVTYKGAVHGFTNPDNKGTVPGLKYDAKADKASWKEMMKFFKTIFKA